MTRSRGRSYLGCGTGGVRLVMIDNFDSFTFNLVQLFRARGIDVAVLRADAADVGRIAAMNPRWICISPGPGCPRDAATSSAVVRRLSAHIPTLGVCLGMQVINEVFGGRTVPSPRPMHGRTSLIFHDGRGIFAGLPSPFRAARYHSLCVDVRSEEVVVTGRSEDGVAMAIRHARLPVVGVQFHPESFLSEHGAALVDAFLGMAP